MCKNKKAKNNSQHRTRHDETQITVTDWMNERNTARHSLFTDTTVDRVCGSGVELRGTQDSRTVLSHTHDTDTSHRTRHTSVLPSYTLQYTTLHTEFDGSRRVPSFSRPISCKRAWAHGLLNALREVSV